MFKQGSYIVCLTTPRDDCSFPPNFVFKQRRTYQYLLAELDIKGSTENGWSIIHSNKITSKCKWRYATKEEAEEYENVGGPYDVTLLEIKIKTKTTQNNYNYLIPIIKQLNKLCIKEKKEELQVE